MKLGNPNTRLLMALVLAIAPSAMCQTFTDGFEGTSISSFWGPEVPPGPGTASLTTDVVHSGAQALKLAQSPVFPNYIGLTHDFGAQGTGSVSVWVNDSGSPNASLGVSMDAGGLNQTFIEFHQDNFDSSTTFCGPYGHSCFQGRTVLNGVEQPPGLLPSTPGWNHFEILIGASGATLKVNGTVIATIPAITTFRFVSLDVWGGFCAGCAPNTDGIGYFDDFSATWTPPLQVCLLYDPSKAAKSGSTIPIKLELCDASGNDVSSSSIAVHATGLTRVSTSSSQDVQDAGNANPDQDFRFDPTLGTAGGYIFNLKTTGLATGSYTLNFTASGSSFSAPFQVK